MPRRRRVSQVCTRCNEDKVFADFSNDRSRNSGKFPWCKSCVLACRTESRKTKWSGTGEKSCPVCLDPIGGTHANRLYCGDACKDKARRYRVFGLEPSEYRALIKAMAGKCPICSKNVKRWEIDHNHKTGESLGPVCRTCNGFLLAYCYHSIDIAEGLVAFLKNPPVREFFGERRYIGPEQLSQLHRMWAWNKPAEGVAT